MKRTAAGNTVPKLNLLFDSLMNNKHFFFSQCLETTDVNRKVFNWFKLVLSLYVSSHEDPTVFVVIMFALIQHMFRQGYFVITFLECTCNNLRNYQHLQIWREKINFPSGTFGEWRQMLNAHTLHFQPFRVHSILLITLKYKTNDCSLLRKGLYWFLLPKDCASPASSSTMPPTLSNSLPLNLITQWLLLSSKKQTLCLIQIICGKYFLII